MKSAQTTILSLTNRKLFSALFFLLSGFFFGLRLYRDSWFFTVSDAETFLPPLLALNALILTVIGLKLDALIDRFRTEKIFLFIALIFFLMLGLLFFIRDIELIHRAVLPATYYVLSEVIIFLLLNLFWIFASGYFTEVQGAKDFPLITGYGLFAVGVVSLIFLIFSESTILQISLNCFLLGATIVVFWGTVKKAKLVPVNPLEEIARQEIGEGGEKKTEGDFKWARKNPFVWGFAIVTVCNFFLIAGFEFALVNASKVYKLEQADFVFYSALVITVFGFAGALFQWVLFRPLFEKLGTGNMNLFAPALMLLGGVIALIVLSDFMQPVMYPVLLSAGIMICFFMRICGWGAEYLFNQTMLPFVYGSLPGEDESRARLLVEGPVTSITNLFSALLLLGISFLFVPDIENTLLNQDFLFVLIFIAAATMLAYSIKMKPLFAKMMMERVQLGENLSQKVGGFIPDVEEYLTTIADRKIFGKEPDKAFNRKAQSLIRLARSQVELEKIERIFMEGEVDSTTRALIVETMLKRSHAEGVEKAWRHYASGSQRLPERPELKKLNEVAERVGRKDELVRLMNGYLEISSVSRDDLAIILELLSGTGLDGATRVYEFINRSLKEDDFTSKNYTRNDLSLIAIGLGSEGFYDTVRESIRNSDFRLPSDSATRLRLINRHRVLDWYAFLTFSDRGEGEEWNTHYVELLSDHPWLIWISLCLIQKSEGRQFISGSDGKTHSFAGDRIMEAVNAAMLRNGNFKGVLEGNWMRQAEGFLGELNESNPENYAPELKAEEFSGELNESNPENYAPELMAIRLDFPPRFSEEMKSLKSSEADVYPWTDYLMDILKFSKKRKNFLMMAKSVECLFEQFKERDDFSLSDKPALLEATAFAEKMYYSNSCFFEIEKSGSKKRLNWFLSRKTFWLDIFCCLFSLGYFDREGVAPQVRQHFSKRMSNYFFPENQPFFSDRLSTMRDRLITKIESIGLPREETNRLKNMLEPNAAMDSPVAYLTKQYEDFELKDFREGGERYYQMAFRLIESENFLESDAA